VLVIKHKIHFHLTWFFQKIRLGKFELRRSGTVRVSQPVAIIIVMISSAKLVPQLCHVHMYKLVHFFHFLSAQRQWRRIYFNSIELTTRYMYMAE